VIRVLIADDHPVVRLGVRRIVEAQEDMTIVGECEDARGVQQFLAEGECDILLLDISMKGKSGLELLKDLKSTKPDLPVLILSVYPEEQYGLRVLRAGAAGYVRKGTALQTLVTAIRQVVGGARYISPEFAETLLDRLSSLGERPAHEELTDREFQVLRMYGSGMSAAQIAEALFISAKTVNTYLARLREKLGIESNAGLIRYAVERGLAD
jgi:DNA-binding NarL/FixJ family response regulator